MSTSLPPRPPSSRPPSHPTVPNRIDFEGITAQFLPALEEYCHLWLPGGEVQGREYTCGSLLGEPGRSLKVNLETGKWADFATGERGGDPISLYAAIHNVPMGEAARAIARLNAGRPPAPDTSAPRRRVSSQNTDAPLTPPPANTPVPSCQHPKFRTPVQIWTYRDASARPLFYVARYEPRDDRKQFVPWTWSAERGEFVARGPARPRPLYGLNELANRPDAPVLIVEGEKSADAARKIAGHIYVCVTWPGGASAYAEADWTPLTGRRCLIWPDADTGHKYHGRHAQAGQVRPYWEQPGPAAAQGIAVLLANRAAEIKILSTEAPDTGFERPNGFDAADALARSWNWETFALWARPRAFVWTPPASLPVPAQPNPKAEPASRPDSVVPADSERVPADSGGLAEELIDLGDTPTPEGSVIANIEAVGLACNRNGVPFGNTDNTMRALGRFRGFRDLITLDTFTHAFYRRTASGLVPWEESDDLKVQTVLQRYFGMTGVGLLTVQQCLRAHAVANPVNQPSDWLNTLIWDGTARVERFLTEYLDASDDAYTCAASQNFWVSLAARMLKPGCKVDTMVILEGSQGARKSSALRAIGGDWFAEIQDSVSSKDFYLALHGKILVEIAELDAFSKAEVNAIKRAVSCQSDHFRAPYERRAKDYPRQCVFVGSTNEHEYLRDATGARRFWPVRIGKIHLERIQADREQLFAEAAELYRKGTPWWIMPEIAADVQESRREADPWEPVIARFLLGRTRTTTIELCTDTQCLGMDINRVDRSIQNRVSRVMRSIGWKPERNKLERYWAPR